MRHVIITLWILLLVLSFSGQAQTSYNVIIPGTPPGGIGGACGVTTYAYLMRLTGGSQLATCSPSTHLWVAGGGGTPGASPAGSSNLDANCWASISTFAVCNNIVLDGNPLNNFRVVRTSSKILTVCPDCSSSLFGYWAFATQWNSSTGGFLDSPVTLTINAGAQPVMGIFIGLGDDNKVHFTSGDATPLFATCLPAPKCVLDTQATELAGMIPIANWTSDNTGVLAANKEDGTAPVYLQGGGIVVTDNLAEGQHFNAGAGSYQGAILDLQPGSNITWTLASDGVTVQAQPNVSLTPTFTSTTSATFVTATNCADSAGAAACGSAAAGRFVADAAATSVVVSTTAVTANSEIFVEYDSSLNTALSVTCNATIPSAYAVTARTAGASFTLSTTANAVNPGCFSYHVVN